MVDLSAEAGAPFKDYYEILHLHPDADAAMVDQAYWHLARLYNTTIPSDGGARAKLDELNEAYSVLRSPSFRREYDKLRDAVLGKGALPQSSEVPQAEAEPPPLAVMGKQRPKAREEPKQERPKGRWRSKQDRAKKPQEPEGRRLPRPRLSISQVRVPGWQGSGSALAIMTLAVAALVAGAEPVLVLPVLVVGLGFATIPLIREMPRLPALPKPALHLPSVGAPRLPERAHRPAVDPDTLRQSTEAMLARWRVGAEGLSQPAPLPSLPQTEEPPESTDADTQPDS